MKLVFWLSDKATPVPPPEAIGGQPKQITFDLTGRYAEDKEILETAVSMASRHILDILYPNQKSNG